MLCEVWGNIIFSLDKFQPNNFIFKVYLQFLSELNIFFYAKDLKEIYLFCQIGEKYSVNLYEK